METLLLCPLCKSPGSATIHRPIDHHLSQEPFQLARCPQCGFVFTNPRPLGAHIERYYASPNYISHQNGKPGLVPTLYYWARAVALRSKYRTVARHAIGRKLLDYGCGTGAFLAYMRTKRYHVTGMEPSANARAQATQIADCQVFASSQDMGDIRFNVITLWHVLEHVRDPQETLLHISGLLDTKGILLIAVPDITSWDAQHYGAHWAALDVPRHLSHFKPKDIQELADQCNLKLVTAHRMWFDALYISMLSEKYLGRNPVSAFVLGLAKGAISNLVSLVSGRSSSSTLFVLKSRL